jgi:hypothetical protein
MTPVERIALEAIALLPGMPDEARRLLAELAAGRRERGEGPLSPAEKMKRYRARRAGAHGNERDRALPSVTDPVTANVTAKVTGHAPPDPQEIPSDLAVLHPSERGSETRVRTANVTGNVTGVTEPVTDSVTPPRARPSNATADGAGGLAVSAWAEGIRSVTRKPFSTPRGGSTELVTLIDCMLDHCADHAARVDWAREQARRFAGSHKGKLNAFSFRDWLNSGDESRTAATPTAPTEGPRRLEERARHEQSMREAEKNRGAPTPEALALARGRPLPKVGTGS